MSRKSILLGLAIIVVLFGGSASALAFLVRHEPAFYRRATVQTADERTRHYRDFQKEFSNLLTAAANDTEWSAEFTEQQINAGIEQETLRAGSGEKTLPDHMHAPRVAIHPDRIRLGFRYGKGFWSTVISINLRVWLVATEPNVLAVELRGVYAGALPISAQSLLESVADTARQQNIEVSWYRHQGYPVAILRFQADKPRASTQLQRFDLKAGAFYLAGRATEATPPAPPPAPVNAASTGLEKQ